MKSRSLFLGLCLLLPQMAFAALDDCLSIETDLDRLACYDRESGRSPKAAALPNVSKWSVSEEKSDFEDTRDVYLSLTSEDVIRCGRFGAPQPASLMLRCQENSTAIYFSTQCHLASGFHGYGEVDVRLDSDKAFKTSMEESTDNRALGLWSGRSAIPFMKKMLGKQEMLLRFTPFNESPATAKFAIAGLDEAIAPLRAACKW